MSAKHKPARLLMLTLILNLCWLPTHLRSAALAQVARPGSYDCFGPPVLIETQRALWDHLGWGSYGCDAVAELVDQLPADWEADPNVPTILSGLWAGRGFSLRVEAAALWDTFGELFPTDPNRARELEQAGTVAGVVMAVLDEAATVTGLLVQIDDLWGTLGRVRLFVVLDWWPYVPPPTPLLIRCEDDDAQDRYERCRQTAVNNFNACKQMALNNWKLCTELAIGSLGGAIACILAGLKWGMGIPAIKFLLLTCGVAALVSLAYALWACNRQYKTAEHNCLLELQRDLDNCRIECFGSIWGSPEPTTP